MSTAAYRVKMGLDPAKPKSKYGNKKTPADDGVVMDSGREATRYKDLVRMQETGQISELRRQVPFLLALNGVRICTYIADFTYWKDDPKDPGCGVTIVEDCKGARTDVYIIKRALMRACHGIEVIET